MCIDLLRLGLVERDKPVQDVVACRIVVCTTLVVWEVILHRRDWQLLLEPVDLVQEEDNAGLDKPPRIANAVEERESLLHTIDGLILEE